MTDEDQLELKVRRILASEVERHRTFLQIQFKYLTWGIGVLLAAGAIIFTYLFGRSIDDSKEQLISTIDSKVVDYRIVESFKKRLDEFIGIAVTNAVEADTTKAQVDRLVSEATSKYVQSASDAIDKRVSALVAAELAKSQGLDTTELIKKVALPTGAVLAFRRTDCPNGWSYYREAESRFIVGVGQGNNLNRYALGQIGGKEAYVLTEQQMPKHQHNTPQAMDNTGPNFGLGPQRKSVAGAAWVDNRTEMTDFSGGNVPVDNLPPFVALQFCIKD